MLVEKRTFRFFILSSYFLLLTSYFSLAPSYAQDQSLSDLNLEWLKKKDQALRWGRDPFVLPTQPAGKEGQEGIESGLRLSAIIYRKGRGVAIINNQIVRVGDIIEDSRVTQIEPDRVVLRGTSGERELRVYPFVTKR